MGWHVRSEVNVVSLGRCRGTMEMKPWPTAKCSHCLYGRTATMQRSNVLYPCVDHGGPDKQRPIPGVILPLYKRGWRDWRGEGRGPTHLTRQEMDRLTTFEDDHRTSASPDAGEGCLRRSILWYAPTRHGSRLHGEWGRCQPYVDVRWRTCERDRRRRAESCGSGRNVAILDLENGTRMVDDDDDLVDGKEASTNLPTTTSA